MLCCLGNSTRRGAAGTVWRCPRQTVLQRCCDGRKAAAAPERSPSSQVTLGAPPPQQALESGAAAGPGGAAPVRCNWYLPDGSSLDRYLWAAQWFVANGYYVLLEHRPEAGDATAHSADAFADGWRWLWRSVACLPNFASDLEGRVFVDLLGLPDATGHRWEPTIGPGGADLPGTLAAGLGVCCGAARLCSGALCCWCRRCRRQPFCFPCPAAAGLAELYLHAMDALWSDTPGALAFFVAGGGQGGASTWGSGFATDKATIAVNDYSGERTEG
jgi:hypothetical protein